MATRKRYAARLRALDDGGNETGPELLHIIFPLGVLPAPGDKYWPLYSGGDAITAEQLGAMGLDCTGTGIYVPPATVTFTIGNQYGLRAVASTPKINVLAPRYEKPRGVVIVLNATGGYPAVRLMPLEGQSFSDTGRKQPLLETGTPPGAAQFVLDYASAPAGLYRVDAWPSGVAESGAYVSETVRVPAGSGQAPVVNNRYPDQEVLVAGAKILAPIAGVFSDPDGDALTYTAVALDAGGQPTTTLPEGLAFNPNAASPFTVTAEMANRSVVIRIIATDTHGLSTPCDWHLTVNRKSLTGLDLNIPSTLDEGKGFQASAVASFSDNSTTTLNLQQDTKLSLAGPDGAFKPAFAEIAGVKLGANGLTTADVNTTVGDSRVMQMKVEFGGRSDTKTFYVVDKSTGTPATLITSVAIWRTPANQIAFLYKTNQLGALEDRWTGNNGEGDANPFLASGTGEANPSYRPAGFESYQYLDNYGTLSAAEVTALASGSTFSVRKVGETALLTTINFTAPNLQLNEARIIS